MRGVCWFVCENGRAELRRSKLISGPSNFSHIGHIGPDEKVNVVQDRSASFTTFLSERNLGVSLFRVSYFTFDVPDLMLLPFLRATAGTAIARLPSQFSVCPSVRLSHGWIMQKRCKLGSSNLYHWLPQRLWFQDL